MVWWFSFLFLFYVSAAQALTCRSVFTNRITEEEVESLVFTSDHPLAPNGRVSLNALTINGRAYARYVDISARIERILFEQHQVQIGHRDTLLAVTVLGDKASVLRNLSFGELNHRALDISGVEIYRIQYRISPRSQGQERVIILIRSNAQDYSLPESQRPESLRDRHHEIIQSLSAHLQDALDVVLRAPIFEFQPQNPLFQTAYNRLAARPGVPPQNPRARMSVEEFAEAYIRAFPRWLTTLRSQEVFHLRPSLWEAIPQPDPAILDIYRRTFQRDTSTFEQNFARTSQNLLDRLQAEIHRFHGSRGFGVSQDRTSFESPVHVSRQESETHSLVGPGEQFTLGQDFWSPTSSRQMLRLSDWGDLSRSYEVRLIVERLENLGFQEPAQLSRVQAQFLLDRGFTIQEVTRLARELFEDGIYLTYSWSNLRQIPGEIRRQIVPTRGADYRWNPQTRTYIPSRPAPQATGSP